MNELQTFLLGAMVAYTPSMVFLVYIVWKRRLIEG